MKKKIHPEYRLIVFKDTSCNFAFLGQSSAESTETIEWSDGKTYPLLKVELSSASHPFYTGKEKILDTEGRVEKFRKKFKLNLN